MTIPREIQIVLMNLADDCWGSNTDTMPHGFLAACATYDVNPGRCDECGEHEHDGDCRLGLCECGQRPGWPCTCDSRVDDIHEAVWEGDE